MADAAGRPFVPTDAFRESACASVVTVGDAHERGFSGESRDGDAGGVSLLRVHDLIRTSPAEFELGKSFLQRNLFRAPHDYDCA